MKKVTFKEENNQIYPLIVWSVAYKESRRRYWEFFSVDRLHFQRRIEKLAIIISPVLDIDHRNNVHRNLLLNKET